MGSAVEIASLYGLLSLKDEMSGGLDAAEKKAKGFGERLKGLGDDVTSVGVSMSTMTAPFIAAMGLASNEFLEFNSNMTNVQAALGKSDEAMVGLSNNVLLMGENSRAGAQASAEAMYEIAGGVADASAHLDILQTSLDVSTAGAAGLDGVVSALVKTMNIYGFAAEDAAHAGDVLVRMVGVGVGSMDAFAAALPPVEGLAKEMGISFDDLGGYMAYMSTKSASVAEGGTQLKAVFSKLMNPSADLAKAIKDMGYESGQAMVQQEGLIGALEKIKAYGGGSFAGLITDQESLLGALALTTEGTEDFLKTYKGGEAILSSSNGMSGFMAGMDDANGKITGFTTGIEGATEAAKAIQMASPAAQLDLLKNGINGLAISVGEALMPAIGDIVGVVGPIVGSIKDWVRANPNLVKQIGTAIGVVGGLGAVLVGLGTAIGVVGSAFTALTSPIGLAIGLAAALVAAYQTNFGGFADFIDGRVRPVIDTLIGGIQSLADGIQYFIGDVQSMGLFDALRSALGWGDNADGWFEGVLVKFGVARDVAENVVNVLHDALMRLGEIWNAIRPGLEALASWFVSDGLPGIGNVISGIWNNVITPFFNFLGGVWGIVGPALGDLAAWFVTDGLPEISRVVGETKTKIEEAFTWLANVWTNTLQPGLQPIVDWFVSGDAWQTITGAVDTVKGAIETAFNWLAGVWTTTLQPALQPIVDWFISGDAWQLITGAVDTVKLATELVFNWFAGVWTTLLQPALQPIVDWFVGGDAWQAITGAVDNVKLGVETVFNWFAGVWTTLLQPALQPIVDWFVGGDAWQLITGAMDTVKLAAETVFNWFAGVWTTILQPALQPIIDWFQSGDAWLAVATAVEDVKLTFDDIVGVISDLWSSVKTGVEAFASGITGALGPVVEFIGSIASSIQDVIDSLSSVPAYGVRDGATPSSPGSWVPPGSRDGGGDGVAGQPVVIGVGAQPELFVPRTSGTFYPANQQSGGGVQIGTVVIQANSEAEGAAGAVGLERKLRDLREGRG